MESLKENYVSESIHNIWQLNVNTDYWVLSLVFSSWIKRTKKKKKKHKLLFFQLILHTEKDVSTH